jgi:hypothetical protein
MADKKEPEQEIGKPRQRCRQPTIPRYLGLRMKDLLAMKSQRLEVHALTLLPLDYTLNNPDTLTKYKSAAQISQKVLDEVTKLCVAGEKIVTICEKGDKLLDEEISKVYRGKKDLKKGTPQRSRHCS